MEILFQGFGTGFFDCAFVDTAGIVIPDFLLADAAPRPIDSGVFQNVADNKFTAEVLPPDDVKGMFDMIKPAP